MKTIVVTGGTSGIGLEIVRQLAKKGHRVIFTARNEAKAKKVAEEVAQATGNTQLGYALMDFAALASVREGAKALRERLPYLDVLLNNAGTWEMEFRESADGIEMNFAVNHLAPMLLTLELLPLLRQAPAARIVNTSSGAHRRNILDFEDLEFRAQPYNGVSTYSQSKLCNLLFSLQLEEELSGTPITVNTVHPGYVRTALFNNMGTRDWSGIPDAAQGARSTLFAALSPSLDGLSGKYLYLETEDPNRSPLATDKEAATKLWDISMEYLQPFLAMA